MDASDITRRILAKSTLAGYNNSILKSKTISVSDWSGNCCGFFDASACQWDLSGSVPNQPTKFQNLAPVYGSYTEMTLVNQGLVVNGCIPSRVVSSQVQTAYVCPDFTLTIPLNNTNSEYSMTC